MDLRTLLFTFDGRINRAKYWLGVLITFAALIAAGIVGSAFGWVLGEETGILAVFIVLAVVAVFAAWIAVATGIKRLHDREKTGWWLLVFYVVPGMLDGVGSASPDGVGGFFFTLVGLGISVWGLVELGCLKGTTGPNAYGPDPLPAEVG
jgi:uncharacterized membrane protein YhaH (DUF805 family)